MKLRIHWGKLEKFLQNKENLWGFLQKPKWDAMAST